MEIFPRIPASLNLDLKSCLPLVVYRTDERHYLLPQQRPHLAYLRMDNEAKGSWQCNLKGSDVIS